ncbi:predicted protein [Streptomyces sp. C]|nr:predicted protein [Streptomyces sp. C]
MGETADLSPIGVWHLYSTSTTSAWAAGAASRTADPASASASAGASAVERFRSDTFVFPSGHKLLTTHQIGGTRYARDLTEGRQRADGTSDGSAAGIPAAGQAAGRAAGQAARTPRCQTAETSGTPGR